MSLLRIIFQVLAWLSISCTACSADVPSSQSKGAWAKGAVSLMEATEDKAMRIPSPDAKKAVLLQGTSIRVKDNGRLLPGTENEGFEPLAELEWAPDSSAFFITESNGGNVGTWGVRIFLVSNEGVKGVDVTRRVTDAFKKTYRCVTPEEPNIGAVKWVNGSTELLLVAEVPPHSSCPEMGKVRGYIVKVPNGIIQKELSRARLQEGWGSALGYRLK